MTHPKLAPEAVMRAAELLREREKLIVARNWIEPGMTSEFALTIQSDETLTLRGAAAAAICAVLDGEIEHVESALQAVGVDVRSDTRAAVLERRAREGGLSTNDSGTTARPVVAWQ